MDWVGFTRQASGEERHPTPEGDRGSRRRKPRPRWVFDTSKTASRKEAAAHDVLEEVNACAVRVSVGYETLLQHLVHDTVDNIQGFQHTVVGFVVR